MASEKRDFGELQLAVLEVLWDRDEATVADVREVLAPDRKPAVSTVSTVLSRLEEQGVVHHRREGRRYVYRAVVDRDEVRSAMLDDLLDRVFGGDPGELVNHLLREGELEGADLERLQDLVDERRS